MQKPLTFLAAALLSACFVLPVSAQEDPGLDTVMATVNGIEITLGHMIVARASLPEQYQELPDPVLFNGILDQLIQQTALAGTFDGVLPPRVTLSLDNETRSLTAGEVLESVLAEPISDQALQAAYDAEFASFEAGQEYNASHILVETEEAAVAIKEELENGAVFAEIAREKSTGPSGPSGGSLGWFGKGMMVPAFEAAVIALESGAISEPVQTQFGWHVIQLNETRKSAAPPLAEVRERLEMQVRQSLVQQHIEKVTEAASIDQVNIDDIDPGVIKNLQWLE